MSQNFVNYNQMTKTMQPCAFKNAVYVTNNYLPVQNEPEDNISLLLSIFDNLYELYEKLSRLSYLIERKIMEHNLHFTPKR